MLALGLGIPALLILAPIPFLHGTARLVWLFTCIPVTSLCLAIVESRRK
jgi:hypothetical protein